MMNAIEKAEIDLEKARNNLEYAVKEAYPVGSKIKTMLAGKEHDVVVIGHHSGGVLDLETSKGRRVSRSYANVLHV